MLFSINAWLDCPEPFVALCDVETGREVARFSRPELELHLEQGDFCLSDFCCCDRYQQQVLVKELLLLRCCSLIRKDLCKVEQQLQYRSLRGVQVPLSSSADNDPIWFNDRHLS